MLVTAWSAWRESQLLSEEHRGNSCKSYLAVVEQENTEEMQTKKPPMPWNMEGLTPSWTCDPIWPYHQKDAWNAGAVPPPSSQRYCRLVHPFVHLNLLNWLWCVPMEDHLGCPVWLCQRGEALIWAVHLKENIYLNCSWAGKLRNIWQWIQGHTWIMW